MYFFLNFRVPGGKAPRFPKKPTIHQDGDLLVMECVLEASPMPEIIWYQGTKVIEDTGRIKMSKKSIGKDTYLLRLEINNPTKDDGGNYRCNACNSIGESNANIALNFQGTYETLIQPPHPPIPPVPLVNFPFVHNPCIMTVKLCSYNGSVFHLFLCRYRRRKCCRLRALIYRKTKNHSKRKRNTHSNEM